MRGGLAVAAAIAALAGCGGEEEETTTETGGLATTTATEAAPDTPPPSGPLGGLADVERIGPLRLNLHVGAPDVRELGAEDARSLDYATAEGGAGPVVGLSLWPSGALARAYAQRFADVLVSDQSFERVEQRRLDGRRGPGSLVRLRQGRIDAAVWTTGRLAVDAIGSAEQVELLLARAPYGEG